MSVSCWESPIDPCKTAPSRKVQSDYARLSASHVLHRNWLGAKTAIAAAAGAAGVAVVLATGAVAEQVGARNAASGTMQSANSSGLQARYDPRKQSWKTEHPMERIQQEQHAKGRRTQF